MRWTLPRPLVLAATLAAVTFLLVLAVFLAIEKRATAGAPDFRVTPIGGIQYEEMTAHPIDLRNKVDRGLVAGLPARERHLRHGQMLFGAFISFTNTSTRPLRSAERIELRDEKNHVYRPLELPVGNPYAYRSRVIRPGTRIPASGSAADQNLAAAGQMLLFRIPARTYTNGGVLELVIHHPGRPAETASLIV